MPEETATAEQHSEHQGPLDWVIQGDRPAEKTEKKVQSGGEHRAGSELAGGDDDADREGGALDEENSTDETETDDQDNEDEEPEEPESPRKAKPGAASDKDYKALQAAFTKSQQKLKEIEAKLAAKGGTPDDEGGDDAPAGDEPLSLDTPQVRKYFNETDAFFEKAAIEGEHKGMAERITRIAVDVAQRVAEQIIAKTVAPKLDEYDRHTGDARLLSETRKLLGDGVAEEFGLDADDAKDVSDEIRRIVSKRDGEFDMKKASNRDFFAAAARVFKRRNKIEGGEPLEVEPDAGEERPVKRGRPGGGKVTAHIEDFQRRTRRQRDDDDGRNDRHVGSVFG